MAPGSSRVQVWARCDALRQPECCASAQGIVGSLRSCSMLMWVIPRGLTQHDRWMEAASCDAIPCGGCEARVAAAKQPGRATSDARGTIRVACTLLTVCGTQAGQRLMHRRADARWFLTWVWTLEVSMETAGVDTGYGVSFASVYMLVGDVSTWRCTCIGNLLALSVVWKGWG